MLLNALHFADAAFFLYTFHVARVRGLLLQQGEQNHSEFRLFAP